jgi:hypothetical protein
MGTVKNKTYIASLCRNGILGGGIYVEEEGVRYRTGKVTVPAKYRNLLMRYEDISETVPDTFGLLPTVSIKMKDGESYRFLVFGRKSFLDAVKSHENS